MYTELLTRPRRPELGTVRPRRVPGERLVPLESPPKALHQDPSSDRHKLRLLPVPVAILVMLLLTDFLRNKAVGSKVGVEQGASTFLNLLLEPHTLTKAPHAGRASDHSKALCRGRPDVVCRRTDEASPTLYHREGIALDSVRPSFRTPVAAKFKNSGLPR
jgi:hypothetical protein